VKTRVWLAAASLSLATVACVRQGVVDRSKGFGGAPTTVDVEDVPVKGYKVHVEHGGHTTDGELLALDAESLFVLADGATAAIPRRNITGFRIRLYDTSPAAVGVWTGIGTVSTVSHGAWAVISAPVWLAVGIPSTVAIANKGKLDVGRESLGPLVQFARFPQGLPPGWPGGHVAPLASPVAAPTAAVKRVFRRVETGRIMKQTTSTTYALTLEPGRATLTIVTGLDSLTAPTPDVASGQTTTTQTLVGPAREDGGTVSLDLRGDGVMLDLVCSRTKVSVVSASAVRTRSPGAGGGDCGDPGVWSPPATSPVDALVCNAKADQAAAPPASEPDPAVVEVEARERTRKQLTFGDPPGIESTTIV
jgi:hypothetical protein